MPTRRVINDSEDEDAGFSPINSPVKDRVDTTVGAIALEGDTGVELPLADSTIDQRSTDPEFFHRIYEEQQHVPEAARNDRVEGISSDKQKSSDPNAKNSSSITDPTRKDSRKKPKTAVDARDFASLTQVTTPRKDGSSGSRMDVYEFPSSDGEGGSARPNTNSRTTKTYGKRKRGQTGISGADIPSSPAHPSASKQGLSLTHTRDEEEALPKPARKKRGSGTQKALDSLDEDVNLLVVPRTAETNQSPSQPQDSNEGQDVVVPDSLNQPQDTANQAAASFFIAPPNHLTVSQKQEYLPMSGSSEHDDHTSRENALPLPHPETQAQRLRSSEATIAYTTPSRYCSSAPGFPELPEDDGRNSSVLTTSISRKAQKSTVDYNAPNSSPDELNSHSLDHLGPPKKRNKNSNEVDELAQDDSWDSDKIGIGTAKRKRQKTDQHHDAVKEDGWDSDKIGAHRESYKPRPSRRRSRAVLDEGDEDLAAPERSMPDTCPPGPGSPEGTEEAEPILISSGQQAPQEQSDDIEGIDPSYLAALPEDLRQEVIADQLARNSQASRTRGRGRPSQAGDTPQPKKRGRKKKEAVNEDASALTEEADPQGPAAQTPAAGKKKRGRPKKTDISKLPPAPAADDDISLAYGVEDVSNAADAAEAIPPQNMAVAPAPSKAPSKRGRKKKVIEETPAAPEEETSFRGEEEAVDGENQEVTKEAKAPSRRGRKRKVVEEPPSADESDDHVEGSQRKLEVASDMEDYSKAGAGVKRKALTDISNTASSQGPAHETDGKERTTPETVVDMQREATPKAKEKETPRSASSTTNQQGKVPLRVGLSKRSRIAPLLKIIRK
ncbi:hypothetical protein LA080_009063 [Diaporthe eres]|nr:hypothetical protein LA080_009063 [Diaporthe eres]